MNGGCCTRLDVGENCRRFVHFSGAALSYYITGEAALFGVGIEAGRLVNPKDMGVDVNDGVEPIADTLNETVHEAGVRERLGGEAGALGAQEIAGELMFAINGEQGAAELLGDGVFALGEAGQAIDDLREILVADASEDGLESAPGLTGLHKAVSGIGFFGVFGDGLGEEVANPELDFEGGQVEEVVVFFGEGDGVAGIFDDGKVRQWHRIWAAHGNPVRKGKFSTDESCGPCA
jgi:hypothetical protein